MGSAEKYKTACIEYAKARLEVENASKKISDALTTCVEKQDKEYGKLHPELLYRAMPEQHLKMAYQLESDQYDTYYANHDGDPAEYLAEVCTHCLSAHNAIQERKKARQRFGVAKRRVAFLGRVGLDNNSGIE